jgi:hypothetical protein
MNRRVFHVRDFDEKGVKGPPDNRRLVCLLEGEDGKVAIWGKDTSRRNIDAVKKAGDHCSFEADWVEPPDDFKEKFAHRYWVPQDAYLKVLP